MKRTAALAIFLSLTIGLLIPVAIKQKNKKRIS